MLEKFRYIGFVFSGRGGSPHRWSKAHEPWKRENPWQNQLDSGADGYSPDERR